jgi:hypothetical protein
LNNLTRLSRQILRISKRKKRTGKINTAAIVFNNTDKNAEELLELFLQEKQAFNLSDETISLYRYHCIQLIQSLGIAAKEPGYKVLTLESYKEFILKLKERNIKDVSVASIARSVRTWLYWLMEATASMLFHAVIPIYQKTVPEPYTDEELAILPEMPKRNCTEAEHETCNINISDFIASIAGYSCNAKNALRLSI